MAREAPSEGNSKMLQESDVYDSAYRFGPACGLAVLADVFAGSRVKRRIRKEMEELKESIRLLRRYLAESLRSGVGVSQETIEPWQAKLGDPLTWQALVAEGYNPQYASKLLQYWPAPPAKKQRIQITI